MFTEILIVTEVHVSVYIHVNVHVHALIKMHSGVRKLASVHVHDCIIHVATYKKCIKCAN